MATTELGGSMGGPAPKGFWKPLHAIPSHLQKWVGTIQVSGVTRNGKDQGLAR